MDVRGRGRIFQGEGRADWSLSSLEQGTHLMPFIARLALALTLIAPLWTMSLNAQPTFSPNKGGTAPAPETGSPGGGGVFRPSGTEVTPPPAPPPTTTTTTPAAAPALDWGNSQVDVVYAEPQNPQFLPIRERLMRRQVLEQLRLFLSPLRLPRKLLVQIDQCNAEQRPYQPGGPVTICYEYVAKVDQIAPRNAPAGGLPRETMIVGAFIQAVLHDVAVATFDILELPVWGRERDAADRLAASLRRFVGSTLSAALLAPGSIRSSWPGTAVPALCPGVSAARNPAAVRSAGTSRTTPLGCEPENAPPHRPPETPGSVPCC